METSIMKTKSNKTYYVLSTTNARVEGWKIYDISGSKKDAENAISDIFKGNDIHAETLLKNALVVSKTTAEKKYHVNFEFDYIGTI